MRPRHYVHIEGRTLLGAQRQCTPGEPTLAELFLVRDGGPLYLDGLTVLAQYPNDTKITVLHPLTGEPLSAMPGPASGGRPLLLEEVWVSTIRDAASSFAETHGGMLPFLPAHNEPDDLQPVFCSESQPLRVRCVGPEGMVGFSVWGGRSYRVNSLDPLNPESRGPFAGRCGIRPE